MVGYRQLMMPLTEIRIMTMEHFFSQVCSELNVPYLDICTPHQNRILLKRVTNDGSHPRAAGYN